MMSSSTSSAVQDDSRDPASTSGEPANLLRSAGASGPREDEENYLTASGPSREFRSGYRSRNLPPSFKQPRKFNKNKKFNNKIPVDRGRDSRQDRGERTPPPGPNRGGNDSPPGKEESGPKPPKFVNDGAHPDEFEFEWIDDLGLEKMEGILSRYRKTHDYAGSPDVETTEDRFDELDNAMEEIDGKKWWLRFFGRLALLGFTLVFVYSQVVQLDPISWFFNTYCAHNFDNPTLPFVVGNMVYIVSVLFFIGRMYRRLNVDFLTYEQTGRIRYRWTRKRSNVDAGEVDRRPVHFRNAELSAHSRHALFEVVQEVELVSRNGDCTRWIHWFCSHRNHVPRKVRFIPIYDETFWVDLQIFEQCAHIRGVDLVGDRETQLKRIKSLVERTTFVNIAKENPYFRPDTQHNTVELLYGWLRRLESLENRRVFRLSPSLQM